MKNAAQKTWVRVLCAVLAVLFAGGMAACGCLTANLANYGAYSGADETQFEGSVMLDQLRQDADSVAATYTNRGESGYDTSELTTRYNSSVSNFCFAVTNPAGNVMLSNYSYGTVRLRTTYTLGFNTNGVDYEVRCGVRDTLTASDGYSRLAAWSEGVFAARGWILAGFCVLGLLSLAVLVWLCWAAGRREDTDGVKARWIDKIPCDLYTAALMLLFSVPMAAGPLANGSPYFTDAGRVYYVLVGAVGAYWMALCLLFFMSWTVRIKLGGWWKNSVVYYILRWLKKPVCSLGRLIKSLPLIWKTALIVLAVLILQLIAYSSRNGLVWFLVNAAAALAVLYAALYGRKLRAAASAMAGGRFEEKVDTSKMRGEFRAHGEDLNRIGDGIALAVEERMKSEHMKTELITNVSHDIKTPLTSIINYVDLLKSEDVQPEKAREYIDVLDRQSQRLRKLTEDVIEASKASTGNIPVELDREDMNVLLQQAAGEYEDKLREKGLEPVLDLYPGALEIMADGRLLWRVFDNIMSNAVKYAMPGTRVYITSRLAGGRAEAVFRNISAAPLNISAEELMERFTRGDSSRSTQGSGLGLSIAESLAKLQKGSFSIDIDGDLFKATVSFDAAK
jgi:signal transduction histidine kinase